MQQYSCNNIIIVTNVIISEFMSGHPGALPPCYLFLTREHKDNESY